MSGTMLHLYELVQPRTAGGSDRFAQDAVKGGEFPVIATSLVPVLHDGGDTSGNH